MTSRNVFLLIPNLLNESNKWSFKQNNKTKAAPEETGAAYFIQDAFASRKTL